MSEHIPTVVLPTGIDAWPSPWDFGHSRRLISTASSAAGRFLDRLQISGARPVPGGGPSGGIGRDTDALGVGGGPMSTIAFLNIGMHGRVNPTLPVVAELVRRSHSVILGIMEP